jgi:hypothetical protein
MRSTLIVLAVFALYGGVAVAVPVAGLFEATAPVADRTEAVRRAAARVALGKVLVKVTGDRGSVRLPVTTSLLQNPDRFVQQYFYERRAATGAGDSIAVRFQFDARMLAEALRGAGIPVWGSERPRTLLWLVLQPAAGVAELVGVEDNHPLVGIAAEQVEARGIPVVLPLLDLDERQSVSADAVRRGELTQVMQASSRYGVDAVLVGDLRETAPGLWQTQWYLLAGGEQSGWSSLGEDPALLVDEAINLTADALAQRYAGAGTLGADAVAITLAQIHTVRDYARALAYLESLAPVARLEVAGVERDQVALRLAVRGGLPELTQTVMLGRVLQPVPERPDVLRLIPE